MNGIKQKTEYLGMKVNKFENLNWQRYNQSCRQYLDISSNPKVGNHYRAKKVAFWNEFLPRLSGVSILIIFMVVSLKVAQRK